MQASGDHQKGHPGCDVQVLYGMDYIAEERQVQHNLIRAALLEHVRQAPESCKHLLVSLPCTGHTLHRLSQARKTGAETLRAMQIPNRCNAC